METDNTKTAFFVEGFENWKKATECFRLRQASETHKDSKIKLSSINVPTIHKSSWIAATKAGHTTILMRGLIQP